MPKEYVPTGRPRGRPKVSEVVKEHILDVRAIFANTNLDPRSVPLRNFCPECFPAGFPDGIRTMGCPHGTWVKR